MRKTSIVVPVDVRNAEGKVVVELEKAAAAARLLLFAKMFKMHRVVGHQNKVYKVSNCFTIFLFWPH